VLRPENIRRQAWRVLLTSGSDAESRRPWIA
jgi:hypothetical protein